MLKKLSSTHLLGTWKKREIDSLGLRNLLRLIHRFKKCLRFSFRKDRDHN